MKTLIIGNGAAGIAVVETMRKIDANSPITIVTDEQYLHYARPRVSDVLAGKAAPEQIILRKREWYEKNAVELILSENALTLDLADKKVFTSNRGGIAWDALVLATGSLSFVPPIKGSDSKGVFTVRTLDDASKIIAYASDRKKAIVLGGGLLGIEAANGLLARGLEVTIVEVMERLLPRQLDLEGAMLLARMIEEKGIRIITGQKAELIERSGDSLRVHLGNVGIETVDMMIVSAGVRPRVDLIAGTKIAVQRGIVVGNKMETNVPGVWACGDSAEYNGKFYGILPAAKEQGDICGTNIAGGNKEYAGSVMSTRLSVLGIGVASLGDISLIDGTRTAAWRDKNAYKKLFLRNGALAGAILLGDMKDFRTLDELVRNQENISSVKDLLAGAELI